MSIGEVERFMTKFLATLICFFICFALSWNTPVGCCMLILQLMLGPSQARIRCFWVFFHLKNGFLRSTYLLYLVFLLFCILVLVFWLLGSKIRQVLRCTGTKSLSSLSRQVIVNDLDSKCIILVFSHGNILVC